MAKVPRVGWCGANVRRLFDVHALQVGVSNGPASNDEVPKSLVIPDFRPAINNDIETIVRIKYALNKLGPRRNMRLVRAQCPGPNPRRYE